MKTQLRNVWESRSPRDRNIIMLMTAVIAVILYMALVQTGARERQQLSASVMTLRMQAARLALQANELQRLRAAPATTASQTDLRALVQAQAAAAGLSGTLVKMDAPDANQIVVVFEAVAFADWLHWIASLSAQQVRLDTCRIEALPRPGMVNVTATLLRVRHI